MLSPERARQLLGPGPQLTDEQLERELARQYALARAVVAEYLDARARSRDEGHPTLVLPPLGCLKPKERESFEERAAIMEYDGELSRSEAESRALRIVLSLPTEKQA